MRKFLNLCSHNIHHINVVDHWVGAMSIIIDQWDDPEFQAKK
jgi:hypothetical protein